MQFTVNKSRPSGSLVGYLAAPFCKLVERLGRPLWRRDGKTRAEWVVEFEGGLQAAVYDWCADQPLPDVRRWHVGGDRQALDLLAFVLDQPVQGSPEAEYVPL